MDEFDPPTQRDVTSELPDASRLGALLEEFRPRLRRMVELRMDPRLRARLDASDVLQEAFTEVARRLPEYRREPKLPFFVWVRFLTGQRLLRLHRDHLRTERRDAGREVRQAPGGAPEASAATLASAIAASGVLSPSQDAAHGEQLERLRQALEELGAADREVLVLRHFEHLSNREVADVLELSEPGASLRYTRAAERFREVLRRFVGDPSA